MAESIFCPKCLSIPFSSFRTIIKSQAQVHKNVSLAVNKLTVTSPSCQCILSPSFICLLIIHCLHSPFCHILRLVLHFCYLSRISQVTNLVTLKMDKRTLCTLPTLLFFSDFSYRFFFFFFNHYLDYKLHHEQKLSIVYNNLRVTWHHVIPNTSPDFNKALIEETVKKDL